MSNWNLIRRWAAISATAFALTSATWAQDDAADQMRTRALRTIDAAIQALGGQAYRDVSGLHQSGHWFAFNKYGQRSGLVKYFEWIEYDPIKWHFQLGKGGRQRVQVYNLDINKAWVKEGKGYVEELDIKDVESFKKSARHDLDVLLRHRSHEEGTSLFYYGPDDITGDGTVEAVEYLDEANDSVVVYFNVSDHMPVRLEYQSVDKVGNRFKVSNEFLNWHEFKGVKIPLRIDIFRDGKPAEMRHVIDAEVNPMIPPEQFLKPRIKEKKKKKKKGD